MAEEPSSSSRTERPRTHTKKTSSNYDARTSLPDDDEKRPFYDGSNLGARTKCTDDEK